MIPAIPRKYFHSFSIFKTSVFVSLKTETYFSETQATFILHIIHFRSQHEVNNRRHPRKDLSRHKACPPKTTIFGFFQRNQKKSFPISSKGGTNSVLKANASCRLASTLVSYKDESKWGKMIHERDIIYIRGASTQNIKQI